jgi:hypothetical protein
MTSFALSGRRWAIPVLLFISAVGRYCWDRSGTPDLPISRASTTGFIRDNSREIPPSTFVPDGWSRPIFSLPQTGKVDVVGSQGTVPDPLPTLSGVVDSGGHRIAVLKVDGSSVRVKEGDQLGRWRISEVGSRFVVLENADHVEKLELKSLK